jgi:subtilisin family serine protease
MRRELIDGSSPVATALDLVHLRPLMELEVGSPAIGIGLVDGPVAVDHSHLAGATIHGVGADPGACTRSDSAACSHGTFVAGILAGQRDSPAPAVCPGCTLLVRPIFSETRSDGSFAPASADDVARAIVECVDAGARIVNLSAATSEPTTRTEPSLRRSLDHAVRGGTIVVAAAGNQGMLGGSAITRHPGVIPVVAYDLRGRPLDQSNSGRSAAHWGLGAPGERIVSLALDRSSVPRSGTSFAAPFVTGALALLWSLFPAADGGRLRAALSRGLRRSTVIPPLMNAFAAYQLLAGSVPAPQPA